MSASGRRLRRQLASFVPADKINAARVTNSPNYKWQRFGVWCTTFSRIEAGVRSLAPGHGLVNFDPR